jgi:glutathione peroxidase-family protein
MHSFLIALIASLLLCIGGLVHAADAGEVDTHDNCAYWASIGECTKNPGYMLTNCKKSCNVNSASDEKPPFNSFYDIVETDIDGNQFKFDVFRGKVVYMINVASYCGYTDENYRMFRELKKYQPEGFVMVLAPCNSFGYQEPGDGLAIKTFAGKQDFKGIILSKADVNGQETRPSFKYLKYATHTRNINW